MNKMMSALLVLAIVCGVSSSALCESKVAILRSGEVIKLYYKNDEPSDVKVIISDSKGEKVFSEELISIHGFVRPYNFSNLPKGDYAISVKDVDGNKSEKICFKDKPWTTHITKLNNDPTRVMVAIPFADAKDFSICIFDREDRLVYKEDQKTETEFAKVFKLKNLDQGAVVQLVNHKTGEVKSYISE